MLESPLTRHFLAQFLENDLISTDTDRHQVLSFVGAALIATGLFGTVLLSLKYLFTPFQTPGWTSVVSLDDTFFYSACSMTVLALVAVAEWDALSLDARDAAILGPLPIERRTMVWAKLSALTIFATSFVVALNLVPSLIHPFLLTAKLPIGLGAIALLVLAHATMTVASGLFGFAFVFGLRELLRATIGPVWFSRISTHVQAALVVFLVAALLLVPAWSSDVVRRRLTTDAVTTYLTPPLWFVGIHEVLGGRAIDSLPRSDVPAWIARDEFQATNSYRGRRSLFETLASVATLALMVTVGGALALYSWNCRRLPAPLPERRRGRYRWTVRLGQMTRRLAVPHAPAQAGFVFTVRTLTRSAPHRTSIAVAMAVGLAAILVVLQAGAIQRAVELSSAPLSFLAIQTMFVGVLLAAFRRAVGIPADLRASWIFQNAWCGNERQVLEGAKRAWLVVVLGPTLMALLPLHAFVVGWSMALAHWTFGVLVGLVGLEASLLGFSGLPFVSKHEPSQNWTTRGGAFFLAFVAAVYGLAAIERLALSTRTGSMTAAIVLAVLLVGFRVHGRRRLRPAVWTLAAEEARGSVRGIGLSD